MALTIGAKQSLQALEQQRTVALTASKRKGQKPATRLTRAQLEQWYAPGRGPPPVQSGQVMMSQTVVGFAYSPCTTPLADLQLTSLSQLRLETHHRGKLLIVRVIGHALRIQAVQNGIEDHEGNVDRLTFYNADLDLSPQQILPRRGIFAIKEPYYKLAGDGGPCVRIDHPSDLVPLDSRDAMVPQKFRPLLSSRNDTAADLKTSGNAAFKVKNYLSAAARYTEAIAACTTADESVKFDLLRNRAMANIHLRRYEQARADAEASLMPSDDTKKSNSKAHYRSGCASYQLRDYARARKSFENARKLNPGDVDTEREYTRTIGRVLEQQTGKYDLPAMSNSVSDKHRRLDHASYTANVEVRDTLDRGKGLFAKRSIKAGDIVFVEKAYYAAFDGDEGTTMSLVMNLNTNSVATGPHATLLVRVVQDTLRNSEQGSELLDLYDGGYSQKQHAESKTLLPETSTSPETSMSQLSIRSEDASPGHLTTARIVDGSPVVDVFQAHQILEANAFACSSLRTTDDLIKGQYEGVAPDSKLSSSVGVWTTASRMNHACDANTCRAFVGDMMIVHATKEIRAGDEVFTHYKRHQGSHAEMRKSLQNWGFECDCHICSAEEKTSSTERVKLLAEAETFFLCERKWMQSPTGMPAALLPQADEIYARLESTYDPEVFKNLPRLGLCQLGLWIARVYLNQGKYSKVTTNALTVLRDHGYFTTVQGDSIKIDRTHCHISPEIVDAAIYATNAFQQRGKWGIAGELQAFAKESYRVLYGTMRDVEKLYGKL